MDKLEEYLRDFYKGTKNRELKLCFFHIGKQSSIIIKIGGLIMEDEKLIENTELVEYTDESINDVLEMEGVEGNGN